MTKRPNVSNGLNIEMLRTPFAAVTPTNITKKQEEPLLVLPGDHNQFEEFPRMRLEMLRMIFREFPKQTANIHETIGQCLAQGGHPVEAVQYGVLQAIQTCMREAGETNAEYMNLLRAYNALHTRPGHYALGATNGVQEMLGFISHGTTGMVALMEVVPEVYENQHGSLPTKTKLKELVPACLQPLLLNLSHMQGEFAVRIEMAMGMHHHHRRFAKPETRSYSFDANTLVLRDTDAGEMLDVRSCVVQEVLEQGPPEILAHHDCLAGLSPMPKNAGGNVFQHLKTLIAGLLEQYWYDQTTRA